jgi:hypothetical protein
MDESLQIKTPSAEIDRFCQEHKFKTWFNVSAKQGIEEGNLDKAARNLVSHIRATAQSNEPQAQPSGVISLGKSPASNSSEGGCAC